MALPALEPAHFTGNLKISGSSFDKSSLQDYINQFYPEAIRATAGSAFLRYVENTETLNLAATELLNGADFTYSTIVYKQVGLVEFAKCYVYFQYMRDNYTPGPGGALKHQSEVAQKVSNPYNINLASGAYNRGIGYWNRGILSYLISRDNYIQEIDSITDLGAGSFQVNTTATSYVEVDSTVIIGSSSYTVTAVDAGVSFTVVGTEPVGSMYRISPFSGWNVPIIELKYATL